MPSSICETRAPAGRRLRRDLALRYVTKWLAEAGPQSSLSDARPTLYSVVLSHDSTPPHDGTPGPQAAPHCDVGAAGPRADAGSDAGADADSDADAGAGADAGADADADADGPLGGASEYTAHGPATGVQALGDWPRRPRAIAASIYSRRLAAGRVAVIVVDGDECAIVDIGTQGLPPPGGATRAAAAPPRAPRPTSRSSF